MKDHETVDDLPEEIGNSVTAHMNEAGELIITQHDVDDDNNERALIFTPSLLHMIQSADETADQMAGQDEGNRWSLEVVIDS